MFVVHYTQLLFDFCFKRPFLAGGLKLRQQRKRAIWSGLFWVLSCLSSGTHFKDSFCPLQFRLFPFFLPAMWSLAWKWWGSPLILIFMPIQWPFHVSNLFYSRHVWNPMEQSIETGFQISINISVQAENVILRYPTFLGVFGLNFHMAGHFCL